MTREDAAASLRSFIMMGRTVPPQMDEQERALEALEALKAAAPQHHTLNRLLHMAVAWFEDRRGNQGLRDAIRGWNDAGRPGLVPAIVDAYTDADDTVDGRTLVTQSQFAALHNAVSVLRDSLSGTLSAGILAIVDDSLRHARGDGR